MKALDRLPPFSPVFNHLMSSLSNEDVSFADLASVIERDTVISGHVLRLVNSALYGRRGTISSVRAAISILGLDRLRKFLFSMSVSRLWARIQVPPGWNMVRFNDHSVAVALLADLMVIKGKFAYPEGAFVAGLLHDLGRLMVAIALPDEYSRIIDLQRATDHPLEAIELDLLDFTHAELSAAAVKRWGLPEQIEKAILYHHHSGSDPASGQGFSTLSLAVQLADRIACTFGHCIEDKDQKDALEAEAILEIVGLASHAGAVREEFQNEFDAMRSSF